MCTATRTIGTFVAILACGCANKSEPLPQLRADGTKMVDPDGRPVLLRGCNLGNWLMIETWMLDWSKDVRDQAEMEATLASRFGVNRSNELMDLYRLGYIQPRDLEIVRSFGFNVVRLPFNCRLLQDESPPFAMNAEPFKWLDHALDLCERAGLYVILDMHGVPGGQSKEHHTGEAARNRLWTDADAQKRFVAQWQMIAERYKHRTVIAAYDLMNEPYGDFKENVRPVLGPLMVECVRAIRAAGDQHVVLLPAPLGHGWDFYPADLRAGGLDQIGFTDHFYPGLFGSPRTKQSHENTINGLMPHMQKQLDERQGPMLLGEFNVVHEDVGGDAMMRRYYDECARRGWMATMWSYKILKRGGGVKPGNWYMVTNAHDVPAIDLKRDEEAKIEAYFRSLATMELAVDGGLREALTSVAAPAMDLSSTTQP